MTLPGSSTRVTALASWRPNIHVRIKGVSYAPCRGNPGRIHRVLDARCGRLIQPNEGLTGFDGQTEPATASRCAGHRESQRLRECGTHESGGLTARPAPSGHCRGRGVRQWHGHTGPGAEPESAALVEALTRSGGPCLSGDTLVEVVGDAGRTRVRVPADPLGDNHRVATGTLHLTHDSVAPDSYPGAGDSATRRKVAGGRPGRARVAADLLLCPKPRASRVKLPGPEAPLTFKLESTTVVATSRALQHSRGPGPTEYPRRTGSLSAAGNRPEAILLS